MLKINKEELDRIETLVKRMNSLGYGTKKELRKELTSRLFEIKLKKFMN